MAKPIYFFGKGEKWSELSNFYPRGFRDSEGREWPTVEHYFQAMKFAGEESSEYRERIRNAHSCKRSSWAKRERCLSGLIGKT